MSSPVSNSAPLVVDSTEIILPDIQPTRAGVPAHDVQFYESDEFLCDTVVAFLADGLRTAQPLVVIATEPHRRAFRLGLAARGFDVEAIDFRKDIAFLDARETLAAFMEGRVPNRDLFFATVGDVFERVLRQRTYLVARAYGEMVDLLWKDGNIEGAIALEELWNEIAERYSFSLLCAYSMGNFFKETHTESFRRICDHHSRVMPTEAFALADDRERLRQIALLQQRAMVLEVEVLHRRELERALRDVIAQRRIAEENARRAERELRDFLENAAEPMHWVGPDGIIIWANHAELEMLGYSREDYVGHHIGEFHADPRAIADILRRLARGEELHEVEAQLVCRDGTIKNVLLNSNVYFVDGKFIHTRCFTRDITHLRRSA